MCDKAKVIRGKFIVIKCIYQIRKTENKLPKSSSPKMIKKEHHFNSKETRRMKAKAEINRKQERKEK